MGIELRAGARLLLDAASFQVADGDKIGLVGRNGAGKTTLARVLAGEAGPAAGAVSRTGSVGYLPQDTMVGDLSGLALDRVLSARGLDALLAGLREAELGMADTDPARRDAAVRRYGHLEERLTVLGGYAAEAEAASLASSLGLPQKRAQAAAAHPVRRPAPADRAGPDPVRRLARRCCSTSQPTTWTPTRCPGFAITCAPSAAGWWSSATTRHCWRTWSTRCSTSTPTGRCSISTTSAGRPTWSSARPMPGAAAGSGSTRSARPPRCSRRRTRCGPRPPRPGRAEHAKARGETARRSQRRPPARTGRPAALPGSRALRQAPR